MRLRLSKQQKTELKKINNEAKKSWREARRTDKKNRSRERAAETALAADVRARILRLLDEPQVEKFNEQLKRLNRKSGARKRKLTEEI